jgi:hypothetical protein
VTDLTPEKENENTLFAQNPRSAFFFQVKNITDISEVETFSFVARKEACSICFF